MRGKPLTPKNVRQGSRTRILSRRKIQERGKVLSGKRIPKQKKRLLILLRSIVLRWK
jgi:hypothetical protein